MAVGLRGSRTSRSPENKSRGQSQPSGSAASAARRSGVVVGPVEPVTGEGTRITGLDGVHRTVSVMLDFVNPTTRPFDVSGIGEGSMGGTKWWEPEDATHGVNSVRVKLP